MKIGYVGEVPVTVGYLHSMNMDSLLDQEAMPYNCQGLDYKIVLIEQYVVTEANLQCLHCT